MYTITHNGEVFFDPRLDSYSLKRPMLLREANKIGTLTFTMFPQHPAYGELKTLKSILNIYRDGELIFKGRPAYSKRAFRNAVEYKCEEITACMNDYMFRPTTFSGPVSELVLQVIASFNNRSQSVAFEPGYIQSPGNVEWTGKGYKGHWDVLQELVSDFGGYIIPRYEYNKIYLDWLIADDLPEAEQVIRFGENLKDLFIETDSNETFSALIPIGGVPAGETEKIDITSVNGGSDVIFNADAVDLYGYRETYKEWSAITDPAELLEAAYEWIRGNAVKFRQSVQISAVDLHNLDRGIEALSYMHWVKAESSRHDLFTRYILSREETPLDKPTGTVYTLGDTTRTFSEGVKK